MALAGTAIWEVRTTGDDSNGGAYNPARSANGVDRSQQASPHVTIDGSTVSATVHTTTTQITLSGYTVSNADLGNHLRISGGTATAGLYEITAVDAANNRWTLDRSAGSSTQTVQGRMGGCLASPGGAGRDHVAHPNHLNVFWVRAGTYTLTTSTPNVPGGPFHGANRYIRVEGYETVRGDRGAKPLITAGSVTGVNLFSLSNAISSRTAIAVNLAVDGEHGAGNNGFATASQAHNGFLACEARRCAIGFGVGNARWHHACVAIDCGTGFESTGDHQLCYATNCTTGFSNNAGVAVRCIAHACGVGFSRNSGTRYRGLAGCIAWGCTGDGFSLSAGGHEIVFCVSVANGGYGFGGAIQHSFINSFAFANTLGSAEGASFMAGLPVILAADPFEDAANGNFVLNDAPGGGALLKAITDTLGGTTVYPFGWLTQPGGGSGSGVTIHSPYLLPGRIE